MLQLYVRLGGSGSPEAVEVPMDATVGQLRDALRGRFPQEAEVRLSYAGRELREDGAALADTGISNEAELSAECGNPPLFWPEQETKLRLRQGPEMFAEGSADGGALFAESSDDKPMHCRTSCTVSPAGVWTSPYLSLEQYRGSILYFGLATAEQLKQEYRGYLLCLQPSGSHEVFLDGARTVTAGEGLEAIGQSIWRLRVKEDDNIEVEKNGKPIELDESVYAAFPTKIRELGRENVHVCVGFYCAEGTRWRISWTAPSRGN
eukprot:TRINITY_DN55130_c0_g1_i1.p1 TRINITY_DN55130_c0_g1~~TRINITY_DN55130_c0_g1_i1.p1  ORF type:complete len:287 (+),score=97.29 TRINITY_DN55130_c0_g1_i1:74-862(+)